MTSSTSKRRWLMLGSLLFILAAGAVIRLFFWNPVNMVVPTLDLTGADPAVRQAIEERVTAVHSAPQSAESWGILAIVLSNHSFVDQAQLCFQHAERLDAKDPRWPHHQGIAQLTIDPRAAMTKFQRAVELSGPDKVASRLRLADLCLQLGQNEEARVHYLEILKKHTNHPRARLGMARLEFQAGELARSREQLRFPLENPLTVKAALQLSAEIYAREGDAAKAKQELARSVELPNPPDWPDWFVRESQQYQVGEAALIRKAEALFDAQRPTEALAQMQKLVQDYPRSKHGWTWIGWAKIRLGQLDDAERSLQTALKLDPDHIPSLQFMGNLRQLHKDRKGADEYYRRVIRKKPDSFMAYFNLGQCLNEEGDRAGAIVELQNAVQCQPYSAAAHALLGELLHAEKRMEAAEIHLQEAVDLDPNQESARKSLDAVREQRTKSRPSK